MPQATDGEAVLTWKELIDNWTIGKLDKEGEMFDDWIPEAPGGTYIDKGAALEERKLEEVKMTQVEEFLIVALKELFHIDHFMSDQGNHIFIDNDPGYFKEKHIWKFTPEELKSKLLEIQTLLSSAVQR